MWFREDKGGFEMNNNPLIVDRLIDEKLAALRAEGMRSQMLGQAGPKHHKRLFIPDLVRFFHVLFVRVTHPRVRRMEGPGIRKALGP
jgi:hypothetical protein